MYRFRDTLPIDISEQTISGDLVTIDNSEEMGVIDSLSVSLSPIQSLNGYDKPWSGGAGKNKCPFFTADTSNGITFTVGADGVVTANGTATADASIRITLDTSAMYGDFYFNGAYGGSPSAYNLYVWDTTAGSRVKKWNGTTNSDNGYQNLTEIKLVQNHATQIICRVMSGQTVNNVKFYPMIVASSVSDATYEPYSNICPISGRTEADTHRTGKNLAQFRSIDETKSGITWKSDGSSIRAIGTATSESDPFNAWDVTNYQTMLNGEYPAGTYTLSCRGWTSSNTNDRLIAHAKYADGSKVVGVYGTRISPTTIGGQPNDKTFTATAPFKLDFWASITSGSTVDFTATIQLELGSTATDYEPYQGDTYTTALGRTVYGGTLDVVSGVLTVDRASITLDGDVFSLSYNGQYTTGNTEVRFTPTPTKANGTTNLIADRFRIVNYTSAQAEVGMAKGNPTRDSIYFCVPPTVTSKAEAIAYFQANPTQVCYELATPQTYQLTPQQIGLLLGENHLWSDGEISVVWHKDLTKGRILPAEAVSINGQYLENVVDGYRTLYTKGRESLGAKLETYSVGTADGEKFKNKRYPARTITVGFQLIGANPQDFRQKFNNLNNLLSIEEADFIFNDETDKFFSGYPIMDASVEAGQDSVKGEWKIYCTYPFKRSVEPIKLTMEDATVTDTTATFTIDYKGARPARPVLRAKFAGAKSGGSSSEDGDCGFVAFMDGEENIIQLGNPEIVDLDEYVSAETLLNKEFVNVSDWTRTGGHTYKGIVTGSVSTSDATDAFWNGGAGQTQTYAKPSYGSGSDLHGAILWKNTAGAVNFTMNMVHRLCCANPSETGVFECGAYNHDTGVLVAGFIIDKSANGTTGIVRYIVNGVQVGTDQIDLSYYNTHFGYCNRTPVYVEESYYDPYVEEIIIIKRHKKKKKIKRRRYITKSKIHWWARTRTVLSGWNYTQSNLNSSIQKDGSYVYFQVGNLPMRTFNVPSVAQVLAHDASVYMGTYGTALNTNMIHSLLFRRDAGVPFAEQPNVFTSGDIVEADCNEATVYIYRDGSIGGHLEPQFGALGNDWESFMLTSGTNVIRATWSEWVNTAYKPQIEIEYNEVFI